MPCGGLRGGRGLTLPRHAQVAASAAIWDTYRRGGGWARPDVHTSTPSYPKRRAAFASVPSASSVGAGTCSIPAGQTRATALVADGTGGSRAAARMLLCLLTFLLRKLKNCNLKL